jgi:hypothetical protein
VSAGGWLGRPGACLQTERVTRNVRKGAGSPMKPGIRARRESVGDEGVVVGQIRKSVDHVRRWIAPMFHWLERQVMRRPKKEEGGED